MEVVKRAAAGRGDSGKNGTRKRRYAAFALVLAGAVALGGVIGLYRQPPGLQWVMETMALAPGGGTDSPIAVPIGEAAGKVAEPGSPKAEPAAEAVVALGRLLPEGEVITVAPSSGVRDARIRDLRVLEGDRVEAGEIIAVLDSEGRLKAAVEAADSTVALRQAQVIQTRAAVSASLAETKASIGRAEATLLAARQDYERSQTLAAKGYTTRANLDQRTAALREAERELEGLNATLLRYSAEDLDTQADVLVAQRGAEAAKADLQRAIEDLEQAYVRSPITGTVLEVHARPGEKPGEEGVVSLGNTDRMVAKLEIYQTQVGRIAVGDPVKLSALARSARRDG